MSAPWVLSEVATRHGANTVLNGASLTVAAGEVVGVVGPNGAGKTSLLRAGLGLLPLAAGEARLAGMSVATLTPGARARLAGYLPQDRRVAWNLPARMIAALGAADLAEDAADARALDALARVGADHLADRGALDMSGGERARVLLARLLATRAPLLIADEPVAGLDPDAQLLTLDLLRAEAAKGAAVVATLHDLGLAARCCDRIIVLSHGRIVAEGPPREALSRFILSHVFRLDGELVETSAGPVLAARRI
ncbi:ABC transporter ATP-binding protein [uncultured Caulobacter sp.]|uniref:ABC transporter ATP-binding protein n=1 Tax=uncultured Caulobacter sp. TaxID=158749 RepID=UPI00262F979D|nr:ABC transporter ATP-binding protein [uncultured Caulobacter sp.]